MYDAAMPNELPPTELSETRPQPGVKACPTDLSIQCPECGTTPPLG